MSNTEAVKSGIVVLETRAGGISQPMTAPEAAPANAALAAHPVLPEIKEIIRKTSERLSFPNFEISRRRISEYLIRYTESKILHACWKVCPSSTHQVQRDVGPEGGFELVQASITRHPQRPHLQQTKQRQKSSINYNLIVLLSPT